MKLCPSHEFSTFPDAFKQMAGSLNEMLVTGQLQHPGCSMSGRVPMCTLLQLGEGAEPGEKEGGQAGEKTG